MGKHNILIKNGRIWDGRKFLSPEMQDVAISDGVIAEIGNINTPASFVFDAKGGIIAPGLIDIHTHIRGCSTDELGAPIEACSYPFGVTAAAEACTLRPTGKAVLDSLLMETVAYLATDVDNDRGDFEITRNLLPLYGEKAVGIKVCVDTATGVIQNLNPLKDACAFAREHNLKVLVHSTGTPAPMADVLDILDAGDICTHIYHGGSHTVAEDDFACMVMAKEKGVILDNAMAGGVHIDFSVAGAAIERGMLPDTISTDLTLGSSFVRGGIYGLTMCMSIMSRLGMTEEQVLLCTTHQAAKAIGKEDICGELAVGRRADVCVLAYEEDPFSICDMAGCRVESKLSYRNKLTVVKGNVVYKD